MKTTTTFKLALAVFNIFISVYSNAQSTSIRVVRPGYYNVPITEVKFTHNGSTYTQTSEASGTITNTSKAVDLVHVKINDGGTIKKLYNFNSLGAKINTNNFGSNVSGVGVYNQGSSVYASNETAWEEAMVQSGSDANVLNYLFYDYSNNTPSGNDFDIIWTKGWESTDFLLVGERNGNTCFALTPLDSNGEVISSAYKLQFGNCYGSVLKEYDWNLGYAPTNITNQPMAFTVVKISTFNASQPIFGFRIDNTGDADPKFFGLSDLTFEDNPNNPLIGGISGNVYNDANSMNNNLVDGITISSTENAPLYVNLVDSSTNNVVAVKELDSNGYFEFLNVENGDYEIVISTTEGTVGQSAPSATLPNGWVFTGEREGHGNGNDGNSNGKLKSVKVNNGFKKNFIFGIQKAPDSDNKSAFISAPTFGSTHKLLNINGYPELSGYDEEDGNLGSGNTLVVTDTSDMNGNELYYNGSRLPLNSEISNFNPNKLEVKYDGDLSTSFSFDYYFQDAASAEDETPATYEIAWTSPLPVDWVNFEVNYDEATALVEVQWSTAMEENNSHFIVLRSDDNEVFTEIGKAEGQGTYHGVSNYQFADHNAVPGMVYYYKVKQVDFDGESSETYVALMDLTTAGAKETRVYPNPFNGSVRVHASKNAFDRFVVTDMTGRIFTDETNSQIFGEVNTKDWPNGVYFFTFYKNGNGSTTRLIKN